MTRMIAALMLLAASLPVAANEINQPICHPTVGCRGDTGTDEISIHSAHASFDNIPVRPSIALDFLSALCNGRTTCREQIVASDFLAEGTLSSLAVIFRCDGQQGFFEFDLDASDPGNQGDYIHLNCYRAAYEQDDVSEVIQDGLLGGGWADFADPRWVAAQFALKVATHLAGKFLGETLFPDELDAQAIAEAVRDVVKQQLDYAALESHQNELDAQLLFLKQNDRALRGAVGQDNWVATLDNVWSNVNTNPLLLTLQTTEQQLRSDAQKASIRGTAFPSYVTSASMLVATMTFQHELEKERGLGVQRYAQDLVYRLADENSKPIIKFVAETKNDMVLQSLYLEPSGQVSYGLLTGCYAPSFITARISWGYRDCNDKWKTYDDYEDFGTCNTAFVKHHVACAEKRYAASQEALDWIDDMVMGWRQALAAAETELPPSERPCKICDAEGPTNLITVTEAFLTWGNFPTTPITLFVEALCNGLRVCDATFIVPGLAPNTVDALVTRAGLDYFQSAGIAWRCSGDPEGRSRFDSFGDLEDGNKLRVRLDCPIVCDFPYVFDPARNECVRQ